MRKPIFSAAVLLLTGIISSNGQAVDAGANTAQKPPQPDSRADRTRAFLGLGPAPDPVAAARGSKLYASDCAFCHGAKATGAEGPDLIRSSVVLHDEKGETIGALVQKGRPERGMPAFPSLTDAQTADIAAFLHSRVEQAANRGLYKVQNVVTGNPKAGEEYFGGAGQCASCHSVSGDLAHIGSKFQPAELQALFLYPASVSKTASGERTRNGIHATVTLPSGQSFSGLVKHLDDFAISLYDPDGNYHSFERTAGVKVEIEDPLKAHRELLDRYTDPDMHNLLAYLVTLK
jgi:mono/diheme cytochrome c family protein